MSRRAIVLHASVEDDPDSGWLDSAVDIFKKEFDVVWLKDVVADKSIGERVVAAAGRVIFSKNPDLPRLENHLDLFPNLKVVTNHGAGMNHIQAFYPELEKRGIVATNLKTPGVLADGVADLAMCLMLAASRNLREDVALAMGSAPVEAFRDNPSIHRDVSHGVLGVYGMGNIGYKVARRARGFDMKIMYHNRTRRSSSDEDAIGATYCSDLHQMLKEVDFLVITCPLTSETQYRFGKKEFECMKPTAVLVNVSRGPVVRSDDLYTALHNKILRAAGLDVTDPEPLPRDHPLLTLPNVIITPHSASKTVETRVRMAQLMVDNALAVLEGRHTENLWRPA